ncbi:MAG: methionyl-tRNA formyltransferase [Candidatus Saccharimonadales bacterium]
MTASKRLVFFGNERLVSGLKRSDTPLLRGLIERGYDIAAVVVNNTEAVSRNARALEVAAVASAHNIPVLSPNKPADIIDELKNMHVDAAILSAYGRIIPQRVIDVFSPIGIINIHPSLLPRHRGSTPIETTILDGDTTAGVSIMQLTAGMDEGPVYNQVSMDLTGTETKFDLYATLSTTGAELLFDLLPTILDGSLQPKPQSTTGVSYTTQVSKGNSFVDPTTESASTIERKVRAYLGFPKTKIHYVGNDVILTAAKVVDSLIEKEFCITCAGNSTLLIEELQAPNGKRMTGSAYLRGYMR